MAGDPIDLGVVGEHALDGHVVAGKPGAGTAQEPGRGGVAFIGVGFDVGQAGVVVDGDVQVGVGDSAAGMGFAVGVVLAPVQAPPAAVGDPTELLDIDVQQFAGPG